MRLIENVEQQARPERARPNSTHSIVFEAEQHRQQISDVAFTLFEDRHFMAERARLQGQYYLTRMIEQTDDAKLAVNDWTLAESIVKHGGKVAIAALNARHQELVAELRPPIQAPIAA